MRNTQKKGHSLKRRLAPLLVAFLVLLSLLGGFLASVPVHLKRADVYLQDLPRAFDGTKLLFLSDIEMCGLNGARSLTGLMKSLNDLEADVVVIAGNYASPNVFSLLTDPSSSGDVDRRIAALKALDVLEAPLGLYAVTGCDDGTPEMLWHEAEGTKIQVLNNTGAIIDKDGASLYLVGFSPEGGVDKLSGIVDSSLCVIGFANDPARALDINISESRDGGQWIDLFLAGHNLGGQICIAGRTLLNLSETQRRFFRGWYMDRMPILVSQGIGARGLNLRFGSQAEAWLLTLKCSDGQQP
ncbi:MAG: hypothetical protein E7317_03370 [Clostridiales bacterium]|nr:hypothetical protein [Clostridiales bacterium]